jgi:hypothetical protein
MNEWRNPNDRNGKWPTFNSVIPSGVEESLNRLSRDASTSLDMTAHWCHLSA